MLKRFMVALSMLLVGGFIYLTYRVDTLLMFGWFERLGMADIIQALRYWGEQYPLTPPKWVVYSLPNALWLCSGLLILGSIWGDRPSTEMRLWLSGFLAIAIGGEIGQATGAIPGSFDWHDILLMGLASVCAVLILRVPLNPDTRRD